MPHETTAVLLETQFGSATAGTRMSGAAPRLSRALRAAPALRLFP
jgi:hypothetical protein